MGRERSMSGTIPSMENSLGEKLKDNTIIIVLGASGDLAKKKTLPALFALYRQSFLPKDCKIVGYARTKMEKDDFHKRATSYIKGTEDAETANQVEAFKELLTYVAGGYEDSESFVNLNKHLEEIEGNYQSKERNRIFYLALPPTVFIPVSKNLKEQCYVNPKSGVNRIIIEKPFGKDLDSARELLSSVKQYWTEDETFRIDHYLGKEMVKNLLVLRFANIAMSAAWDKNSISNVQITFKEPFGTEGRGGYFDEFGMIRDVLQNHLLQVLSILTMERPVSFAAEDIRDEKVKVLRAIPPIEREDTLLGQYVAANGKPGYLDDSTVPPNSVCPTFAATTLWIHNPRWEGVPFILKAGKALNEAKVEIRIQFKDVTQGIFKDIARNELVIRLQPNEAIYMKLNCKTPGLHTRAVPSEMDLTYKRRFSEIKIPEAYEALILDALHGDHSNFVRHDELDVAWKIFTPILHWIDGKNGPVPKPLSYPYGSRGPKEMDDFIKKYGYRRMADAYFWPVTNLASL
ncbi:glucose-6-P dehydrogenase [Crepidotus variabilis]|uniref:Glucose-6-phosphate 1-dehydrogenase n=1 Tax=Crepidotus variabilis TaxID=179855 RepID=A0A9P6ESU8_9AGAR|nr:glucose-6-P dehydrogenase [Crepidotus variabilis]